VGEILPGMKLMLAQTAIWLTAKVCPKRYQIKNKP
jgi:hypothetical protein